MKGLTALGILIWAGFWIGVVWVACHFISKYW